MDTKKIVIVGAGVIGLTNALLLSKNKGYAVTVIAKHMPGDYDIEYASPWAGANFLPTGKAGSQHALFEENTWPELERLARDLPESGIHFQDARCMLRNKDIGSPSGNFTKETNRPDAWYSKIVPNFRTLRREELPAGIDSGITFTGVCINTSLYLPWLTSQCLKAGVVFKRGIVDHIADAASQHHTKRPANLIVNCTGLSSLKLGGVEDKALYPLRAQIVLVRNESKDCIGLSGTDDGPDEMVYTMHRAAGGGTILGGCCQANNWESQPDLDLAIRIMKRCIEVDPEIVGSGNGIEKLSIVRNSVGLRPAREGGIRVERERISLPHKAITNGNGADGNHRGDIDIVHAYGHAGYGYQTSYGCAQLVEKLVAEALESS